VSFDVELQRYLSLGIDLQYRRLEWIRLLKNGEPYQNHYEERVKWKQEVLVKSEGVLMVPATWDILPTYF
jgi:hypothetical protein